jgi:acetoin utilization protein AcuB
MFIKHYMTRDPITIRGDLRIPEAKAMIDQHHFRHLPVTDEEGMLLGMITDRDLRSAYPSTVLSGKERSAVLEQVAKTEVGQIMSTDFVSLPVRATVDDAVLLFEERNVGALPVCDRGKVVGILSQTDLMQAFRRLFGLGEKGATLLSIQVNEDTPDLSRLVEVLEREKIPFTRLVRTSETEREPAMIYLRINTFKLPRVHRAVEEAGFSIYVPSSL